MYLVVIAWLYVVLLMALAEAFSPQGTVLGAIVTGHDAASLARCVAAFRGAIDAMGPLESHPHSPLRPHHPLSAEG